MPSLSRPRPARWCAVLSLVLVGGCAAAEPAEERELSSSKIDDRNLEADEPTPLEVGTSLTVRLSVNIRSQLLPKATVADIGPMQAIHYGKAPNLLFIVDGDVSASAKGAHRCEIRGLRPAPAMDEKYFPPTLPNPLAMTVVRAGEGSIILEAEDEETTWTLDCSSAATLAELRGVLGAGSRVTPD